MMADNELPTPQQEKPDELDWLDAPLYHGVSSHLERGNFDESSALDAETERVSKPQGHRKWRSLLRWFR